MRTAAEPIYRRALLTWILAAGLAQLAAGAGVSAQTSDKSAGPATKPTTGRARDAAIGRMEEFYAKIYGEPLDSAERLPRELAIVSLSRIDAEPVTERLLSVFKTKDRDPVVQYLAWEALHARHATLSPEQRARWVAGGLKAAAAGAFPGATAAPLLLALAEHDPAAFGNEPTQFAARVVQENDLAEPSGKATLDALRQLLAAWHEPRIARGLIKQLNKSPALAPRIDHVLRGLPGAPPEGEDARKAWNAAAGQIARLSPAAAGELKPYTGKSTAFGPPERITDPADRRWRAELEIAKLAVSDFDLVWCIDSTGSMNDENQLVAQETGLVLRVFALVSRRARCGTIYFRHETDAKLMQSCCERAKGNPQWYQVKGHPLTPRGPELMAQMSAERIPAPDPRTEGNVHPGCAFHAALAAAMDRMPWSKDAAARKAIVLVGDSHVTPGSEAACEKLVADAKRRGFQVHALAKGGAARSWNELVQGGGGAVFPFRTAEDEMPAGPPADLPDDAPFRRRRQMMMEVRAAELDPHAVFGRIAATVIRDAVAPPYRDRVDPLVTILLPYAQAAALAERNAGGAGPRDSSDTVTARTKR